MNRKPRMGRADRYYERAALRLIALWENAPPPATRDEWLAGLRRQLEMFRLDPALVLTTQIINLQVKGLSAKSRRRAHRVEASR